ncbi:MAG: ribonuclease D [Holosporales bacterium]|jgi:ribonuclease D
MGLQRRNSLAIYHFWDDLPENFPQADSVAIDTETLGLRHSRDRLCLVQLSCGDGTAYLIQFSRDNPSGSPRLKALLENPQVEKLFHFGRFDIAVLYRSLGVLCQSVYCTKIASRFARTYTDRHGLRELCRELLAVDISKAEQSSDWGASVLSEEQKKYAARDVLYLHVLRKKLDQMLIREGRDHLAKACFKFLPQRALLDCVGWEEDIFSYNI